MSVFIEVSFQDYDELSLILDRLEDLNLTVSTKEYKSGKFRRCYLRAKKKLSTVPVDNPKSPTEYPSA